MRVFELDYQWQEKQNALFVDMIHDMIRDHTRHNPISSASIADACKERRFPATFNSPVAIRQVVSYLRRHKSAQIGTCNKGCWQITDIDGWESTMSQLEKRLRLLQSTFSAMRVMQNMWYCSRGITFHNVDQTELFG